MNEMKQTAKIAIVALCVVCVATMMSGCLESGYEYSDTQTYTEEVSSRHRPHDIQTPLTVPTSYSPSLSTQHVSGIEVTTTISNVGTLHVSGVENTVTVTNSNVERIYLSGVDNIVYIPASSDPYISQSGVDCAVYRI